jgi:photosystem II stability/assembly factor-like uncharacterized protein
MGRAGRLDLVQSGDGGRSWSAPWTVVDGPEDDRNPALGQLRDGTLLLAYAVLSGYLADGVSVGPRSSRHFDGVYVARSSDRGRTWSKGRRSEAIWKFHAGRGAVSPYGKLIQTQDGTVLLAVYFEFFDERGNESYVFRSPDGGRTWGEPALVGRHYNETALAELPDGSLLAALRSERGGHVAVARSSDGGRVWSEPVRVTRDSEHPADLLVRGSGEVVLTFGQRNRPLGAQALVSNDSGRTWDLSRPMLLAGDAPSGDCGYPSSVELPDGKILTMFYQVDDTRQAPSSARARAIRWEVSRE